VQRREWSTGGRCWATALAGHATATAGLAPDAGIATAATMGGGGKVRRQVIQRVFAVALEGGLG
jgi:hypothetical protein